jgi:hypothetical protein
MLGRIWFGRDDISPTTAILIEVPVSYSAWLSFPMLSAAESSLNGVID